MINSFEIRVPAVVESYIPFILEIRALDIDGKVVTSDSTTVIEVSTPDGNIEFDGDDNGIYGQVGDNQTTLNLGVAFIKARDTKGTSFTMTVLDSQSIQQSRVFDYAFNCLILQQFQTTPSNASTKDAYQFFKLRDTTLIQNADEDLQDIQNVGNLYNPNPIAYLTDSFSFFAPDIAQGDNTPVITLTNNEGGDATQDVSGSRATYQTNEINGEDVLRFDGDDFYVLDNENKPPFYGNSDFTAIFGVKLLQSGGVQTLFSQSLNDPNKQGVTFRYDSGWELLLQGDAVQADLSVKTSAASVSTVYYVVFERRGDQYRIEIDNTLGASTTNADVRDLGIIQGILGARSNDSEDPSISTTDYFSGDLLEVSLLPGTFTTNLKFLRFYEFEDVWKNVNTLGTSYTQSLQSSYDFDAIYGHEDANVSTILRDLSGKGHHATQVGSVTQSQTALVSDGGFSHTYGSGASSYLPLSFDFGGTQHTFHFWVTTTDLLLATDSDKTLFTHPNLDIHWEIFSASGAGAIGFFDGTYRIFTGVTLPRDGLPHLLSFVFGATSCELYLDGASQGVVTYTGQQLSGSTPEIKGHQSEGVLIMDVVAYKNATQNSTEVLDVYNSGT
jgi:hypothetical protein